MHDQNRTFPHLAQVAGSDDEIPTVFRRLREDIAPQIAAILHAKTEQE